MIFVVSSISVPAVMASSKSTPVPLAAKPLSALEANWVAGNGNAFNQNYNPQNVINSSNAQYLGLSWLFPLPTHPTALLNVAGGLGVGGTPLIINGLELLEISLCGIPANPRAYTRSFIEDIARSSA